MKSKNCQKVVLKALGHILYGSNFIASDVTLFPPIRLAGIIISDFFGFEPFQDLIQ